MSWPARVVEPCSTAPQESYGLASLCHGARSPLATTVFAGRTWSNMACRQGKHDARHLSSVSRFLRCRGHRQQGLGNTIHGGHPDLLKINPFLARARYHGRAGVWYAALCTP